MNLNSIKIQLRPSARSVIHLRGRPRQWEGEYRINEVLKGSAEYQFDDMKTVLREGDIVLLRPGWRTLKCLPSMDTLSIRFDLTSGESTDGILQAIPPCIVFSGTPKEKEMLRNTLQNAREEMALDQQKDRTELQLRLALSFFLSDRKETPETPQIPEKLSEIIRELTLHPEKRLSMAKIAKRAGCSERQLRRLFFTFYKMSPSDFAIHQRIRHAKDLLLHEGSSVKDTAYSLGYPNPYSFSLQFKKMTHISPSRFKEMARH